MLNNLSITALLPMKAHSQRVRGKNFRSFAGKPLFKWILDTLLSIPYIDRIVINTDAEDILLKNGLNPQERILIRQRKPEICGDFVSMNKVLEDDVKNVKSDIYLMTHTTNPLIKKETIENALRTFVSKYQEGVCDSLFTVNKIQTRFYRSDASPVNHDPNNLIRTQDLEPWFEENSNLYLFTQESFFKTHARIGKKPLLFEQNKLESVDIDDQESWDLAELLIER